MAAGLWTGEFEMRFSKLRFRRRALDGGAGAMIAAGFLTLLFGLSGSRLSITHERAQKDATSQPRDFDPESQPPVWPPKTSRHSHNWVAAGLAA